MVSVHDAMRICQAVCGKLFLPTSIEKIRKQLNSFHIMVFQTILAVTLYGSEQLIGIKKGSGKILKRLKMLHLLTGGLMSQMTMGMAKIMLSWMDMDCGTIFSNTVITYGGATRVMALCELPSEIPFWNQD